MKFTTTQAKLVEVLGAPTRVANTRAATQAVGGVLIEALPSAVVVSGTDGKTAVKTTTEVVTELGGSVLLPARKLYDCVRALDGDVTIETADGRAKITAGRFTASLQMLPAGNFPDLFIEGKSAKLTVDPTTFVQAVAQVVPAVSRDTSRAALVGVRFEIRDNAARLVTTDAVRVAIRELDVKGGAKFEGVLPLDAVLEVQRAATSELTIEVSDERVQFRAPHFILATTPIKGEFPEYARVIPATTEGVATIARAELMTALRRVSLIEGDAPVRLSSDGQQLTVAVESPTVGEAEEQVDAKIDGDLDMTFSSRYLQDGVDAVRDSDVVLRFNEPLQPVLLEGESFSYVLMPLRVKRTGVVAAIAEARIAGETPTRSGGG